MNQAIVTRQLALTLEQAGFKITHNQLLNIRTGESWLHQRVICRTSKFPARQPKTSATCQVAICVSTPNV